MTSVIINRARVPVTIIRPDGSRVEYSSAKDAARGETLPQSWIYRMCHAGQVFKGFRAEFGTSKN